MTNCHSVFVIGMSLMGEIARKNRDFSFSDFAKLFKKPALTE